MSMFSLACMTAQVDRYEHPETAEIDEFPPDAVRKAKSEFVAHGVMFVPRVHGLTETSNRDGWLDLYSRRPSVVTIEKVSLEAEPKQVVALDVNQKITLVALPTTTSFRYHAMSTFRFAEVPGAAELLGNAVLGSREAGTSGSETVTLAVTFRVGKEGKSETMRFQLRRTQSSEFAWST